jgi:glucose-6-phosphate isomerase
MEESQRRVWAALAREAGRMSSTTLGDLLANDPERPARFTFGAADLRVDLSRQLLDAGAIEVLVALARAAEVEEWRSRMFAGDVINETEGRAVLHVALRAPASAEIVVDGVNVVAEVHHTLRRMAEFADGMAAGTLRGASGRPLRDVVNIGIGGSDLGPAMAHRALLDFADTGVRAHFVSNVDPADIATVLSGLDPATTAVVVSSKTFTTQETMANARTAMAWLSAGLGKSPADVGERHLFAVTSNVAAAQGFGVPVAHIFPMWDWVGGRFSLGSAIGFSLMCAIGDGKFRELLDGMHEIDRHFCDAPLEANLPVLLALVGVWNRNGLGCSSHAVIPYLQPLVRFPAYLQQLEMESNGKRAQRDGDGVDQATAPVLWGEPGTNGQHAFFQLLHQGTDIVPVDFIGAARSTASGIGATDIIDQHDKLTANMFAQAAALALGAPSATDNPHALGEHRAFPGNRPSTTIVMSQLTPRTLGQLIALYEHKTFVQGCLWGINSFDQWGVELGKALAGDVLGHMARPEEPTSLDAATRRMVAWYLENRSAHER